MDTQIALSIVVPLYNEEESVAPLVGAVAEALRSEPSWELVLVDDGSQDRTREVALELARADLRVRVVQLARNYGQTQAMQAGFDHARGDVVVSMDGDLQNDPSDIPQLMAKLEEGYDLVAGYRERRQDDLFTRRIPSWIANRVIRWVTDVSIRDNGCSLKAYRRTVLDRLHLYSDMHRFIPALAATTVGASIAEIPVKHHARRYGRSKYGLSRVVKVAFDILTIKMIGSFRDRPFVMFSIGSMVAAALGVLFTLWSILAFARFHPDKAYAYVFPASALLWVGLACYLLMLGLIAEVAVRKLRESGAGDLPVVREEPGNSAFRESA